MKHATLITTGQTVIVLDPDKHTRKGYLFVMIPYTKDEIRNRRKPYLAHSARWIRKEKIRFTSMTRGQDELLPLAA